MKVHSITCKGLTICFLPIRFQLESEQSIQVPRKKELQFVYFIEL